jgi:hypothetical protein
MHSPAVLLLLLLLQLRHCECWQLLPQQLRS